MCTLRGDCKKTYLVFRSHWESWDKVVQVQLAEKLNKAYLIPNRAPLGSPDIKNAQLVINADNI